MSLGNWLDYWFETWLDHQSLAVNTLAMYHRAIAALPSWLLDTALDRLDSMAILRYLRQVQATAPRAAELIQLMLRRAIEVAATYGYCDGHLMDPRRVPTLHHRAAKAAILTREELARYMEAARESSCYPLHLAACIGLRRSECLGLRWNDVDMASGVLYVRQQRLRVRGAYQAMPLKTAASRRALRMPGTMLDALRSWPRSLSGWVCDVTPERFQAEHQRVIVLAGVTPVTLHGLRHTFATLSLEHAPMKAIQHALGHSSYKLTADLYADHLPEITSFTAM